jgi:hypothetical protein
MNKRNKSEFLYFEHCWKISGVKKFFWGSKIAKIQKLSKVWHVSTQTIAESMNKQNASEFLNFERFWKILNGQKFFYVESCEMKKDVWGRKRLFDEEVERLRSWEDLLNEDGKWSLNKEWWGERAVEAEWGEGLCWGREVAVCVCHLCGRRERIVFRRVGWCLPLPSLLCY